MHDLLAPLFEERAFAHARTDDERITVHGVRGVDALAAVSGAFQQSARCMRVGQAAKKVFVGDGPCGIVTRVRAMNPQAAVLAKQDDVAAFARVDRFVHASQIIDVDQGDGHA